MSVIWDFLTVIFRCLRCLQTHVKSDITLITFDGRVTFYDFSFSTFCLPKWVPMWHGRKRVLSGQLFFIDYKGKMLFVDKWKQPFDTIIYYSLGADLPSVRSVRDFEWGNLKRAAMKRQAENRMTDLDKVNCLKMAIFISQSPLFMADLF